MTDLRSDNEGGDLVVIAALVSRVEALCFASMLEDNGIAVHVGATHYGSTEFISLALGGYRIWIAEVDREAASDLIREVGSHENWTFSYAVQRAVLRLIAFWAIVFVAPFSISTFLDSRDPVDLFYPAVSLLGLRVNPQGSGDYYLTPSAG